MRTEPGKAPPRQSRSPIAFTCCRHLAEALDQVFNAHVQALKAVNEALSQAAVSLPDGTVAVPVPPPSPPHITQELAHQRRAQRLALYQQIWALHRQGWPGHAIATQLGIGKNTVFRSLRTPTFPERKQRSDRGRSVLTPYNPISLNAGTRGATTPCGSSGSSNSVGTPAAISPLPATRSVCARRRARCLSSDHATDGRSWRNPYTAP